MIGWIQGKIIDKWNNNNRQGLLLETSGIGFEVNLLKRSLLGLELNNLLTLWVHQINKDDGINLYGFKSKQERDVFRLLISVNSVGPKSAMSLLEENESISIIKAILQKDIKTMSKAQGIGEKTAQRIMIELTGKIPNSFYLEEPISSKNNQYKELPIQKENQEIEIIETLKIMGYEEKEINEAFCEIIRGNHHGKGNQSSSIQNSSYEEKLKALLICLSQKNS